MKKQSLFVPGIILIGVSLCDFTVYPLFWEIFLQGLEVLVHIS